MTNLSATHPVRTLQSMCVFCGASKGDSPAYEHAAHSLGRLMAENHVDLVFGAGNIGMMGAVSRAILDNGGQSIGIIPEHLTQIESPNSDLTELHVVDSMHTRKQMMFNRSDAFCVLPGGFGTMDETFEVLTWVQIGLHGKPFVLLNTLNYWQPWLDLVQHIVDKGFAQHNVLDSFALVDHPEDVIPTINAKLSDNGKATVDHISDLI
jgi:uncharacterized protein (TIGR00730 family)